MKKLRKLMSSDDAIDLDGKQHLHPCPDCPMARDSLPGWLGGSTPEEYRALAHSDAVVECHCIRGSQCAGMAIYRANVAKRCDPPNLKLPKDRERVFDNPFEFLIHHSRLVVGDKVTSRHFEVGTYVGPHPTLLGSVWIDIPGTGQWAFHISDIEVKR